MQVRNKSQHKSQRQPLLGQSFRSLVQTYPTQLAIGLFLLIIATTLSAGVPAYWLTHTQLNQQVATHLRDAQQATLSLLQNEQRRLENIALLFAQRPTLSALLAPNDEIPLDALRQRALEAYIADFQSQIGLDLLLICSGNATPSSSGASDGEILAGSLPLGECPAGDGFVWVGDRPALIVREPLVAAGPRAGATEAGEASAADVQVITGLWLDEPFLRQLAAGTGVQQSLVGADGRRLVSSVSSLLDTTTETTSGSAGRSIVGSHSTQSPAPTVMQTDDHTYYRLIAPLMNRDERVDFYSENMLAADGLFATRNRVLGILLTSTGIVAILGVGLGVWSIRRITSPLASLTSQAERISQGEFDSPILDFGGPREVQTLTAALQRSQASVVQALQDRADARDRLDNLVQSLVEGVVIVDHDGTITFWNQGAALISGWPAEQAQGLSLDHVLPPLESHQPSLLDSIPPPGQRRRVSVLTSGGKSTVLEVTSVRSEIGPNAHTGAQAGATHEHTHEESSHEHALVLRDVTEEEAMHHLRAYFLANISHEFRTPLSTLNASMEILMDENREDGAYGSKNGGMSGDEMRALLKPIHLSLLELQTLIDNLLEGSTIEAGEFRLRRRVMTINEAITGALTLVQPMFERRRQTISLTEPAILDHLQGGQLYGDRVRLTQVLINLLANASKYTPMGEAIDLTVEVQGGVSSGPRRQEAGATKEAIQARKPESYRIMVADRGPGIPEAERVNLFRRFVRLDTAEMNRKSGDTKGKADSPKADARMGDVHGTGIGLYVVKTTIEAHGGRVGIEDRPGGGSIFWFEIPCGEVPE